ncbi:cytochrome bd oxidase small subunit CydS [Anaerobacillus sp. MEB173]
MFIIMIAPIIVVLVSLIIFFIWGVKGKETYK